MLSREACLIRRPSVTDLIATMLLRAAASLGGATTSDRPRPSAKGDVGHCAVCARVQKLRKGVMVQHGYTRPGRGYIVGPCFGVAYPPYEASNAGCLAYVERLEGLIQQQAGALERLKRKDSLVAYLWIAQAGFGHRAEFRMVEADVNGRVKQLGGDVLSGEQTQRVERDGRVKAMRLTENQDVGVAVRDRLKKDVEAAAGQLRLMREDLAAMEKRAAAWVPAPLPVL